ncbi:hypothetical protein GCM10023165_05230 [Variovorax defluvii]|uniref:Uncharacterized protein n=1 Tax=Variovorax defluvii TaxID=913761 RepID=A0ABP8GWZ9_9BURK
MQQALNGLVHHLPDLQNAPLDVGRYAAKIALATGELEMDVVMGWTTLNRRAAQEASNARARRQAETWKK